MPRFLDIAQASVQSGVSVKDILTIAGRGSFAEWQSMHLSVVWFGGIACLEINYNSDSVQLSRRVFPAKKWMVNDSFELHHSLQGKGVGLQYLRNIIAVGTKYGWKFTAWCASSDENHAYNGYYTWARIGYEGKILVGSILPMSVLPAAVQTYKDAAIEIASEFAKISYSDERRTKYSRLELLIEDECDTRGFVSVQAIIRRFGLEWWKLNGVTFYGKFDCRKGSHSMKRFEAYCKECGL